MASASAFVIPLTLFFVGTRMWALGQASRLHDAGADVPRSMGVRAYRHGHLRGAGGAARALHRHRRDGRRHGAAGDYRRPGALLARWGRRGAGRDVYVFFGGMRGTAWVNAFQTVLFLSFGAIALLVIGRRHGRLLRSDGIAAGIAVDGAAADARADLAAVVLQLHVHPAVHDRISTHHDLLPDGATDVAVPPNRHLLSALPPGDLAAVRLSGRRRECHARRAPDSAEAGRASGACHGTSRRSRPTSVRISVGRRRETMSCR